MTTRIIMTLAMCLSITTAKALTLDVRHRLKASPDGNRYVVSQKQETWNPHETALIVCDMWDAHTCKGVADRTAELAPTVNQVVQKARALGIQIIHAPSGTMDFYSGDPTRKRAKETTPAINLPETIGKWRHWINENEKKIGYPIDHSDGGCDCQPPCDRSGPYPWTRQTADGEEPARVLSE